jgi:hypothetical protein
LIDIHLCPVFAARQNGFGNAKAAFARLVFNSPTQRKMIFWFGVGQSEYPRMTHKVIILEFVIPTLLAIALGIVLTISAVYLIDNYLAPIDQAEAEHAVASGP